MMINICFYRGRAPLDNLECMNCSLFLEVCNPIVSTTDGYSGTSECDMYMCKGCIHFDCLYKKHINL